MFGNIYFVGGNGDEEFHCYRYVQYVSCLFYGKENNEIVHYWKILCTINSRDNLNQQGRCNMYEEEGRITMKVDEIIMLKKGVPQV